MNSYKEAEKTELKRKSALEQPYVLRFFAWLDVALLPLATFWLVGYAGGSESIKWTLTACALVFALIVAIITSRLVNSSERKS